MPLSPLLSRYDHVVLDLDGCVWVGERPTRGAAEAVTQLRHGGKTVSFVTNDARRAPEDYVRKLWSLGLQASLEEVVTVGAAIQHLLASRVSPHGTRGGGVFVIGSPAIHRHVADAGERILNGTETASEAELVVVAGHDGLLFEELKHATQAVLSGAQMLAAGRDRTFPAEDGPWPATGAVLAALEYATDRTAQIVGKPDPQIFHTALDRLASADPERTLAIGDRLDSDLEGASAAGIDCAIVLTGASTRAEAEAAQEPAPVAIASDLHELILGL